MERCPTCKAKYRGKRVCHRCRTDLGPLLDIGKDAKEHYRKAAAAFREDDYKRMHEHARRACSLLKTPETTRMLACASLLVNDFSSSLSLWKSCR